MSSAYRCDGCGLYFEERPMINSIDHKLNGEIKLHLVGNGVGYSFDVCETCLKKFINETIPFVNMTKKISVGYHVEEPTTKVM